MTVTTLRDRMRDDFSGADIGLITPICVVRGCGWRLSAERESRR